MNSVEIAIIVLLALSLIFSILGVIGLFRFPDFYTRIHAAGLVSSFGLIFAGIAVLVFAINAFNSGAGEYLNFSFHLIIAMLVVIITGTTSTHAIARSAYRSGNTPHVHVVDALKDDADKIQKQEAKRK